MSTPERLRDSRPALRLGSLILYVALAAPLYPRVDGYTRSEQFAHGLALALVVLVTVGTAFWLAARMKRTPKSWPRATLSIGALATAFLLAFLSAVGNPDDSTAASQGVDPGQLGARA